MPTFNDIKNAFRKLPEAGKEKLLKDICGCSKDAKLFLEGALLGQGDGEKFLREMEKETIGKIYRRGEPKIPSGRTVRSIIARAKKSRVSVQTMMDLEKLAYRGFIEFLNEFGGGPDSFCGLAGNHFGEYLKWADGEEEPERTRLFEEAKKYLLTKNNMYCDEVNDIFDEVTRMKM